MNLQPVLEQRAKVEEFTRKHRIGLLTLLFTDLVGSTKLKQELGDREAVGLIQRHHALVRELLGGFKEGEEIGTAGDSFFIVFTKPSDAAQFSLLLQNRLRREFQQMSQPLLDRVGIHIGEVVVEERGDSAQQKDLYGLQVDICARVILGRDVPKRSRMSAEARETPFPVAWPQGTGEPAADGVTRLFSKTWENPAAGAKVKWINFTRGPDLFSESAACYLFAVTIH